MGEVVPADEQSNYETFRDCLSEPVLKALAMPAERPMPKKNRHTKKSSTEKNRISVKSTEELHVKGTISSTDARAADAEDLGEFIQYLSSIIFPCLPSALRTLSYPKFRDSPSLQDAYSTPLSSSTYTPLLELISPTAIDSLTSYALLPPTSDTTDLRNLLLPVLHSYISAVTAAPPIWTTTRTTECELCARDWVPLTYHHLIPKSTHERVRKRGWHAEEMLGSVAWLCRACHSFVHRLASNEGLAREFYTVELILGGGVDGDGEKVREVEGWVKWVGGVRWKSR
ncbi:hypothetical protein BDU57DRAFT_10679 [Ampelomyces quisqualis]|uniref:HNH domain-containing protein n=1 Tax=Ampelomyces quisqualis TaxID=50730 RepID=A0A6A5QYF6_AMPQU|nr:hypothetical protein BDU57DRAFT_10679 [Ampelomyces quisqualis]